MSDSDTKRTWTRRYIELLLRRPVWVLAIVAGVTALALTSISHMSLGTPFKGMFREEDNERYTELTRRFGTDLLVIWGIEDRDFLSPEGQERLRTIVGALKRIDGVERVQSALDAVRLEPGPLLPVPVRYADEARADPSRSRELQKRLAADPLFGEVVVGRDAGSTAVVVTIADPFALNAREATKLYLACDACFTAAYPEARLHRIGITVLTAQVLDQTFLAIRVTLPLAALAVLVSIGVLFGRLWPAFISLASAGVAVVWTLGAITVVVPEFNLLLMMIPAVLLVVAVSDVIHLCSAYMLELGAGRPKREAILGACSEVGRACLFTSLTTFVGFVGLGFVPVPAVRILGWGLGLGVGIALLMAVTLTPIFFSIWPTPRPLRGGVARLPQQAIDRFLAASRGLALRRPGWVIGAFGILAVAAGLVTTRMEIETDLLKRLPPDNPVRIDAAWFGGRFHGRNIVQVYVKAPSPADLERPAFMARVADYEKALHDMDGIHAAVSLVDILSAIHRATPAGRDAPPGALPERPGDLRACLGLLRLGAGDGTRALVDRDDGMLRILASLEPMGMREVAATADRIEALARDALGAGCDVHAVSAEQMAGDFIGDVVDAQRNGLAVTVALITLLMILGLRSLSVGLGSIVPNLIPLGVLTACLVLGFAQVDSDCFILLFISLGIGVDDTIHFLHRYRLEMRRGIPRAEAIGRTFDFAGRGIVVTSVVLAAGFLPILVSDWFIMRIAGTLMPVVFGVALLADVLLIPAMAQVGWLRFGARGDGPAPGASR
jgi:predicted RND superfamily exporter protein